MAAASGGGNTNKENNNNNNNTMTIPYQNLQKYLQEINNQSNSYLMQNTFVKTFKERLNILEQMTSKLLALD